VRLTGKNAESSRKKNVTTQSDAERGDRRGVPSGRPAAVGTNRPPVSVSSLNLFRPGRIMQQ